MRGRKPLPPTLRIAAGKPAQTRPAPAIPGGPLAPPYPLSAEARGVWERIAPELVAAGILKPAHATTFATFCELQGRFEADPGGAKPAMIVQIRAYGAMFGLDPSSRPRVAGTTPAAPDGDDPWAALDRPGG